jgi:DNA-binding PadR family transcriptional regulator
MSPADRAADQFLPLTSAVFQIMLALADGASHGYAIMQQAEALPGAGMRLGAGTLYRSIQRMLVDGLIVELTGHDDDGPEDERRRRYRLTPLGESVARAEAARLHALVDAAQSRGLLRAPRARRSEGKRHG